MWLRRLLKASGPDETSEDSGIVAGGPWIDKVGGSVNSPLSGTCTNACISV